MVKKVKRSSLEVGSSGEGVGEGGPEFSINYGNLGKPH